MPTRNMIQYIFHMILLLEGLQKDGTRLEFVLFVGTTIVAINLRTASRGSIDGGGMFLENFRKHGEDV